MPNTHVPAAGEAMPAAEEKPSFAANWAALPPEEQERLLGQLRQVIDHVSKMKESGTDPEAILSYIRSGEGWL
jgi:hypothetical protein